MKCSVVFCVGCLIVLCCMVWFMVFVRGMGLCCL